MKEMGSRLKFLLRRWNQESRVAVDCEQQEEDDPFEESPSKKRRIYCKYCNRWFSRASALGGHIRIHRKKIDCPRSSPSAAATSLQNNYGTEEAGSAEIDLSQFLSGWKVHRKRGLRQARRSSKKSAEP